MLDVTINVRQLQHPLRRLHFSYASSLLFTQAYNAFANRVASLKRKLDSLKSTLPGPEDSPIPSPSEDAPSPTGSDSPYLGPSRAQVDPELDGKAMDEADVPSDNRHTEDMDMSDEEAGAATAGGQWLQSVVVGHPVCA